MRVPAKCTNGLILNNYIHCYQAIKRKRQAILILLCFFVVSARSQSVAKSGVWSDYGTVVSSTAHPEFKGRLVNVHWADIEPSPNVWNWTAFDKDIADRTAGNLPVIFMVYTRMSAPAWIFTNGVPKVNETDERGVNIGYSPYYLDADYNIYFKRMITKVREHLGTLPASSRNNIVAVQACFGSTGDQICYKGNVAPQYAITDAQFDSLFKVYSLYYYNEYKNLTPKIKLLSNPQFTSADQINWLIANCPGGWLKTGLINRGLQLNMEGDKKEWLFDILNKPWNGEYIMSRSEWVGPQQSAGWWTKNPYKSLFAIMCYNIYWGLDYPNETSDLITNNKYDSAFHFFNKYAGQKVAATATNAMCAFKDVLDASNAGRFPAKKFGKVDRNNISRYVNIRNAYASYGAKLEDQSVLTGNELKCATASGTNDVGWLLLPGNYDRYLHQIDANATSAGYWNVDSENLEAMYGRFARGFDIASGKNALYFDLEDAFITNTPLNGKYAITIEVTYYDNGTGGWQLYYDAQSNSNKASVSVTCGNTKTWKKKQIVLSDAYFGNRSTRKSDFYIKSTKKNNVIFSVVELARPAQSINSNNESLSTKTSMAELNKTNGISTLTNPVTSVATMQFYAGSSCDYTVQVSDLNGRILLVKKGKSAPGLNTEKLNVQHFAAGMYFVVLTTNKGDKQSFKLLKQ